MNSREILLRSYGVNQTVKALNIEQFVLNYQAKIEEAVKKQRELSKEKWVDDYGQAISEETINQELGALTIQNVTDLTILGVACIIKNGYTTHGKMEEIDVPTIISLAASSIASAREGHLNLMAQVGTLSEIGRVYLTYYDTFFHGTVN